MKDITLILLDEGDAINPATGYRDFYDPIRSIQSELNAHNISSEVLYCDYDSIPSKIDSNLVTFLNPRFLVKSDYIFNAINLNNILRDFGILFGPVLTQHDELLCKDYVKNSYYEYDLNFGDSSKICDITGESHNYGSLYNAIISGSAYNRCAYTPSVSPRLKMIDSPQFFNQICKNYKIYYCSNLPKLLQLEANDFTVEAVSDYYYKIGYRDGLSVFSEDQKKESMWKRFVESPETINTSSTRWLYIKDEEKKQEAKYLELLVILKCKYQIGFYEGITGRKMI